MYLNKPAPKIQYRINLANYPNVKRTDIEKGIHVIFKDEVSKKEIDKLLRALRNKVGQAALYNHVTDDTIKFRAPIFDEPHFYPYTDMPFAILTKVHIKHLWKTGISEKMYKLLRTLYHMNPEKRPLRPSDYIQENFTHKRWPKWVYKFVYFWIYCCEEEMATLNGRISKMEAFKDYLADFNQQLWEWIPSIRQLEASDSEDNILHRMQSKSR